MQSHVSTTNFVIRAYQAVWLLMPNLGLSLSNLHAFPNQIDHILISTIKCCCKCKINRKMLAFESFHFFTVAAAQSCNPLELIAFRKQIYICDLTDFLIKILNCNQPLQLRFLTLIEIVDKYNSCDCNFGCNKHKNMMLAVKICNRGIFSKTLRISY